MNSGKDKMMEYLFSALFLSISFSIALFQAIAFVIFVYYIVSFVKREGVSYRLPITYATLFYILAGLISIVFSVDKVASLRLLTRFWTIPVWFIFAELVVKEQWKLPVKWFLIGIALASIFGSALYLGGLTDRAHTTSGRYSTLAYLAMTGSLISIVIFISSHLMKEKIFVVVIFLAALSGLFFSLCRSQLIGIAVALLFLMLFWRRKLILPSVIAVLLFSLLLPQDVISRMLETFVPGGDSDRIAIWENGVVLIKHLPFLGYGPFTFSSLFPKDVLEGFRDPNTWNWHNDFLQTTIDNGIPGILGLLFVWGAIFNSVFRIKERKPLYWASSAILISIFVVSLLNLAVLDIIAGAIFWLSAVTLAVDYRQNQLKSFCPHRILLIRTDRLGDVVQSLPTASALKQKYPDARIDMLVSSYTAQVPRMCSSVDSVVERRSFFGTLRLIQRRRYDMAVLLHPTLLDAFFMALSGIPITVGTAFRGYSFLFAVRIFQHRRDNRLAEWRYNLGLLAPFNIDSNPPLPVLSPPTEAVERVRNLVGKGKIAIFHPGSGGSSENLSVERFIELGKLFYSRGFSVIVTGSAAERAMADKIVAECNGISLTGQTTIQELAALISIASVFISGSTGPLHLAAAMGTPVVGIFERKELAVRWQPYGKSVETLYPEKGGAIDSISPSKIAKRAENIAITKGNSYDT